MLWYSIKYKFIHIRTQYFDIYIGKNLNRMFTLKLYYEHLLQFTSVFNSCNIIHEHQSIITIYHFLTHASAMHCHFKEIKQF